MNIRTAFKQKRQDDPATTLRRYVERCPTVRRPYVHRCTLVEQTNRNIAMISQGCLMQRGPALPSRRTRRGLSHYELLGDAGFAESRYPMGR